MERRDTAIFCPIPSIADMDAIKGPHIVAVGAARPAHTSFGEPLLHCEHLAACMGNCNFMVRGRLMKVRLLLYRCNLCLCSPDHPDEREVGVRLGRVPLHQNGHLKLK